TNSINDASGNALTATTRNVSVTKDTTKPQVVSATYKNVTTYNTLPTANGAIVVKFSEPVTAVAAATAYSVVNDAGTSLTTPINSVAINPLDDTELVLSLSTAVASTEKSYLVLIPSGAVTDKSLSANANDAVNQLVDVSAGVPVAADTTAPAVASVTPTAATSSTSGSLIAVTFTEADSGLDLATVINTNNYRLDGMPLPTGSYITVEGTVAKINIPAGRIAADKIYILTVSGIKDKAGNVMSTYVNASDVTLKDDIRPVLTTATLNANGTVSLGFSEGVNTAVGKEADFVVILNGVTLNSAAYTLADGVGAEAGKYVLSVKTSVEEANGSTITNDTLYIDVDGSTTFNAGDIIVSQVADATTSTGNNYTAGTYNLNNASSLTIKTVSSPTLVADVSALANKLVGNTQIVVK
ncbi:MAG: trimeric autotransporter adhesin, partial [Clostridiales bacterium]|nr:trimeric autotransporter adhesin [Clostridiales bacterium]